jgi:hypothetical protein
MHLMCDVANCITHDASFVWCRWLHHTWCISCVMSLTPSHMMHLFVWCCWLHHHLMHLLTFYDLTGLHHHLMYLPVRGDVNTP